MTIARCFVGYGQDAYESEALRYAYAIGRQYCADRIPVWTSNDPELSPPPLHHRYIPVDMPVSSDQWGVAYPAGTVLLVDTTAVFASRLATIEADWANWWNGNFQEGGFDLYTNGYMAVPASLPGAYTERLVRDWRASSMVFYDWDNALGVTGRTYDIRTATGFTRTQWVPNRYAYGYTKAISAAGGTVVGTKYYQNLEASTGYRKVQYQLSFRNNGDGVISFLGSIVLKVSHNADGSIPVATSDGDTVDYTGSHGIGDFTYTGTGGFNSDYSTAWIDAGEIVPTLGTLSMFRGSLDTTGVVPDPSPVGVSFRLSPRVDVPAPFTVTDRGGVIVRGGTPT